MIDLNNLDMDNLPRTKEFWLEIQQRQKDAGILYPVVVTDEYVYANFISEFFGMGMKLEG